MLVASINVSGPINGFKATLSGAHPKMYPSTRLPRVNCCSAQLGIQLPQREGACRAAGPRTQILLLDQEATCSSYFDLLQLPVCHTASNIFSPAKISSFTVSQSHNSIPNLSLHKSFEWHKQIMFGSLAVKVLRK